jgi:hypothetical protein
VFEPPDPPTVAPKDDDVVDCEVDDGVLLVEGSTVRVQCIKATRVPPAANFPMAERRVLFSCVDLDTGERLDSYAETPKKLKCTHKFYRYWSMALGHKPGRSDRPPRLGAFAAKRFKAVVRTVRTTFTGQRLADDALHSVIDFTEPLP